MAVDGGRAYGRSGIGPACLETRGRARGARSSGRRGRRVGLARVIEDRVDDGPAATAPKAARPPRRPWTRLPASAGVPGFVASVVVLGTACFAAARLGLWLPPGPQTAGIWPYAL